MVLELHIWGPAFGLASIDPHCLATIAYLQSSLEPGQWSLTVTNDPSVSPFNELPALRNGQTWVSGFGAIVGYLKSKSNGRWDLDADLDEKQRADCTAYTAFVESRGAPLLDLSLFVSSENYTNITRIVVGDMLTWPNSWTIPGRLRQKAKKRSEHLGLSGLDVDAAAEEQEAKRREEGGLSGQIPNSLKKDRTTLSGLLGKGVRGNQFRLACVTDDFLEPMQDFLGEKEWLLETSGPTSLDCLAVGYLALMMQAKLPHPWLEAALKRRYQKLAIWAGDRTKELFGGTDNERDKEMGRRGATLPWRASPERTWMNVGTAMLRNLTGSLPIIGPAYLHPKVQATSSRKELDIYNDKQVMVLRLKDRQLLYGQLIASCVGIATTMGLLFWAGLLRMPMRQPRNARRDFGVAGTMLGLG